MGEIKKDDPLPQEPKWERKGSCQRCGRCCSTVVTTLRYVPALQDYLEWLSLHQGVTVKKDKRSNLVEVEFRMKCRMLRFKNDKALCKIYDNRPKVCREFPTNPTASGACPGFLFKLSFPDPAKAP